MITEQDDMLLNALSAWRKYARYKIAWENKEKSNGVKAAEGTFRNRARRIAVKAGYDPDGFFEICEKFVRT